jgi:hypothetical protein
MSRLLGIAGLILALQALPGCKNRGASSLAGAPANAQAATFAQVLATCYRLDMQDGNSFILFSGMIGGAANDPGYVYDVADKVLTPVITGSGGADFSWATPQQLNFHFSATGAQPDANGVLMGTLTNNAGLSTKAQCNFQGAQH